MTPSGKPWWASAVLRSCEVEPLCCCVCFCGCRANRAGWLAHSPQAKMELYNPLVMSKLLWTRDVARWNPFNTDSFLFIDGERLQTAA